MTNLRFFCYLSSGKWQKPLRALMVLLTSTNATRPAALPRQQRLFSYLHSTRQYSQLRPDNAAFCHQLQHQEANLHLSDLFIGPSVQHVHTWSNQPIASVAHLLLSSTPSRQPSKRLSSALIERLISSYRTSADNDAQVKSYYLDLLRNNYHNLTISHNKQGVGPVQTFRRSELETLSCSLKTSAS